MLTKEELDQINRFSKAELTADQVYTFSVRLCDNEVDRGFERFGTEDRERLGELFLGKSGIFDHQWSAKGQTARIYRTEVVREPGTVTAAGDEYCWLKAWAYLMRTEKNQELITEIEGGIKKEVSVGCSMGRSVCSVCGAENGACGHVKGQMYGEKLCFMELKDPIRFYSSALPHLYKFVLEQSQMFAKEALNDHQRTLRMRGRPKIKLARNYEEAVRIFDQYRDNMLGIISDMSFMHNGVKDPYAGYKFGQYVRKTGLIIPFVLESSEASNHVYAKELNASFIDKNSKSYPQDLKKKIMQRFGFGDFVILNPHTKEEIMRIKDLKDLQKKVFQIPDDSLVYHLSRNHFSRFFYSRAMFPPAEVLKHVDVSDYKDMDEARKLIFDLIVQYRRMKNTGVVAVYQKDRFDEYSNFARIGDGSLGGKGRGLAFIGAMVKRYPKLESDNFAVNIPKTVVICTDIFDEFMETNELYPVALGDADDETILRYFLRASLPSRLIEDLMAFFDVVKSPIAVRSSSLLEDSHYQPFAGIYSTYMVPKIEEKYDMLRTVSDAIKAVYASVFYKDSKAYMTATSNLIDQEKMAIVLQEVVGSRYNDHFYPTMSGVARSLNFYPIGNEKAEDGIANIALGLGKYIVDGGQTLRFSPRHPHSILQMSTMDFALRETQTRFYALDLKNMNLDLFHQV